MSAAYGLVRFTKTGNVYMCCYEGTTDIMLPYFFKPEECVDENGCYSAISYGRRLNDSKNWDIPDESKIEDLDDVEIFSDYGDGFYWMGKGSETLGCIVNGINFYNVYEWQDGEPNWVQKFWLER